MKYATPFIDLFRPLNPAESKSLTESIKVQGVVSPVVVYQSAKHGPAIIDGVNRWGIAEELKLPCPVDDRGELDDDVAEELADELNAARRHLTAEDIKAHAAKRRGKVAELRSEGESIRTIAEKVGVSKTQVEKDIKEAQVSTGGQVKKPKKVKGKDGKEYKADKPKKPAKPAEKPSPFPFGANAPDAEPEAVEPKPQILSTPKGEIAFDAYGRAMPNGIGDYFGDETWKGVLEDGEIAVAAIETFRQGVQKAQSTPWLYIDSLKIINKSQDLRNDLIKLMEMIRAGQPYALCGHCDGKKCDQCRNTGYVTKEMTSAFPDLYAAHARKAS